jgi:two-component system, OmpR family, sensor histidine kinase MprB
MSLRTRIAAAAGVAVAVAIVVSAALVYVGVRSELRAEVQRSLEGRAQGFAIAVPGPGRRLPGPPRGGVFIQRLAPATPFGGARGYAQIVEPDGRALRPPDERSALPVTPAAKAIARRGSGRQLVDTTVSGTHLMVLTQGTGTRGAVQIARPLNEVDSQLRRILILLVVVAAAGIALAAGLGALVARTALKPIERFTRRTEAVTGDPGFSERIAVEGRDELGRLAQSFNTALDALEASVQAQQQLVADASHELRTPIATLRANIQVLEDADRLPPDERARLRDDIVDELDQLTELVSDVVELARGTKPDALLDDVRLDEIVAAAVDRARRRAEIVADVEPTLVRGEPERIGRAVTNLLDNAVKWSPPGAVVEVELAGGILAVRDHGPGFAAADLPHVFERFYRADTARGMAGSGLGLAIVKQAAEAHGGWAGAENAPGGGALIRAGFGEPIGIAAEPAVMRSG